MTPDHFEVNGTVYHFGPKMMERRLWFLATKYPGKEVVVIDKIFQEAVWRLHEELEAVPVQTI